MKHIIKISVIPLLVSALILVVFSAGMSAPGDNARVWVQFVPGQKANVQDALQQAGAEFHYQFDDLEAFVVTISSQALKGIERNPNVVSVEEDVPRYLLGDSMDLSYSKLTQFVQTTSSQVTPYGIEMVQAPAVWGAGYVGAGIKVCVIDTGFYTAHEDFAGVVSDGYSQVGTPWYTDGHGHGTHVAGTIAAQDNEIGVVGVSPGVSLFIIKIFNDDGQWTLSSDLVDAIYRCQDGGAKVISMSLGGSRANGRENRAFNTLYQQGILHVAAAGNAGDTSYSYPASYDSVISVAAIDETKTVADFSQKNNQVELAAPGVDVLSTLPFLEDVSLTVDNVTYSGNHIEFSARGEAFGALVNGGLCTSTGTWTGKVVLCERGEISFFEKVSNVQNSGGVAAVIYNNEPGNFLGTLGDGNSSNIPAISLSQENGQYLVANKESFTGAVASFIEKPASGYQAWSGTSMATPHVSAVAALVWSSDLSLTNIQVREALQQSAEDLGETGKDNAYGYGLVQAYAAFLYLGGGNGEPPPPGEGQLHLTVSTDKTTYNHRDNAVFTFEVTDGTSTVSRATINWTLTTANGRVYNGSGETDSNGSLTSTFTINAGRDGRGTYTLEATATKDGYETGSGSTTFQVN
jgi:serine protease